MQHRSFGFIKNSRQGRRMLAMRWVLFIVIVGIVLMLALLSWQGQTPQT